MVKFLPLPPSYQLRLEAHDTQIFSNLTSKTPSSYTSTVPHSHSDLVEYLNGRMRPSFSSSTVLKMHCLSNKFLSAIPLCNFRWLSRTESMHTKHLIYLGIFPSKIVISGDSAGGNIAVVLLRHVSEQKSDGGDGYFLPNLVIYTLWGSSIDIPSQTCAHIDTHRDYITDQLAGFTLEWGINLYFPDPMEITDSWFSLLFYSFSTPVPIWMVAERQREVLSHPIVEFAAEMKEVEGNKVELHEF